MTSEKGHIFGTDSVSLATKETPDVPEPERMSDSRDFPGEPFN